jgi:hypothetical protein
MCQYPSKNRGGILPILIKREREREITTAFGTFTLDVKSVLNENLGGILGGTQC